MGRLHCPLPVNTQRTRVPCFLTLSDSLREEGAARLLPSAQLSKTVSHLEKVKQVLDFKLRKHNNSESTNFCTVQLALLGFVDVKMRLRRHTVDHDSEESSDASGPVGQSFCSQP